MLIIYSVSASFCKVMSLFHELLVCMLIRGMCEFPITLSLFDTFAAVNRNVFITDDVKIVDAVHSFLGGVRGVGANYLALLSKLVDVGRVPRLVHFWMTEQCAMF